MNAIVHDGLVSDLRRLGRVRAPRGFVARVLAATGEGDRYAQLATPIGTFFAIWNRGGVREVRREAPIGAVAGSLPARVRFDLSALTDFEQAVLRKTLEIPRGQVRSYGWVAREIGRPRAVRAVGTALAHNPVPILIPCHRVVRSDGALGEYGAGGTTAKRTILDWEGAGPAELERRARAGLRFTGSRTTRVFCHPTCSQARRIQARHRVDFHDEHEARTAGFRPCLVCRPAALAA
ncbi:MAG: methylated-DNA--[protein]-cysteine S-methyltransferase [Candidatus Dormibacteraeota bacterium]|nr:methylated-DNA--[protein]-cysteine S-methyltransferase [Candidatus Dormibacteraeota bacterium]